MFIICNAYVSKIGHVQFNTEGPGQTLRACPVMEQKDGEVGSRQDEACGKEVMEGNAGLCRFGIHPLSANDMSNLSVDKYMYSNSHHGKTDIRLVSEETH